MACVFVYTVDIKEVGVGKKKSSRVPYKRLVTLTADGNRKLNELLSWTSARSISHAVENAINVHWEQVKERGAK